MTEGALLYVEEFNRVPEETMNVLLGVLSERDMHVPRYGRVAARPTFRLVAAMNPFDAVGTARVAGLYDRSCRVAMGYQDEDAELRVVEAVTGGDDLVARAVRAVRTTRDHPELGSARPCAGRSTPCSSRSNGHGPRHGGAGGDDRPRRGAGRHDRQGHSRGRRGPAGRERHRRHLAPGR